MFLLRLSLNKSSNLVLFDPALTRGTKEEIQLIPLFKWFSLLLVPVPKSSPPIGSTKQQENFAS